MNILEYTKIFHEMEIVEGLFEIKTSDGIFFWDIVRHDVFYLIFRNYLRGQTAQNKCSKISLSKLVKTFSSIMREIKCVYSYSKYKYIFFKCSRNIIDGKEIDIISNDYLQVIGKDSLIIENYGESKYFNNKIVRIKKRINKIIKIKTNNYHVDEIIKNTFGVDVFLDSFIKSRIEDFKVEKKHYMKLLKRHKPLAVFFIQNGIQKSLMSSCRELGILSIELQHGIVNYCHPLYSYPKEIKHYKGTEVIVPEIYLGFSDYWIKVVNYPVKKAIAMGNTYYSTPIFSIEEKQNEITFISVNIFQKKIESYLDIFLEKDSNTKVNLKLHPNQSRDIEQISKKYSIYKNVKVYYNEVTLSELFNRSKEVIVVTSTAAYEAINFGCKLKIIKDELSYDIIELFDHPNVIILDKPLDIFKNNNNEPINTIFFDVFNECKLKNLIEHIEKINTGEWDE